MAAADRTNEHDHAGHELGPIAADHLHDQDHSHAGHSHAPADFGLAFAIGISLNLIFVATEVAAGLISGSMALLADAGHNFSDVLGLVVAWVASLMAKKAPSPRFSHGLRGSSILAALFNAIFLLVAVGAISWEAIQRLSDPAPVTGSIVMIVAGIGIVINGVTALMFMGGAKQDINQRGAYLHMLSDALVSAGVVVAGLVILWSGWVWIDPVISLVISAIIMWSTWGLLRESLGMAVAAVPAHVDPDEVRRELMCQPGVQSLHDLHIWPISTTETALTCHLVMPGGAPGDAFLHGLAELLQHDFRIAHATFQVETDQGAVCPLAPDDVV